MMLKPLEGELVDPLDPSEAGAERKAHEQHVADLETEARTILGRRREAYVRLFAGNPMEGDARIVMDDLRTFCRGDQVPWDTDPRVHAVKTGRFEVFKRIEDHVYRPLDSLMETYS